MAVDSCSRIKFIIQDLKTSWYFRFWLLLWVVCAIMTFVVLIEYSSWQTEDSKTDYQRISLKNEKSLAYPKFHLHSLYGLIVSVQCAHAGNLIPTGMCFNYTNTSQCISINGPSIKVSFGQAENYHMEDIAINCTMVTNITGVIGPQKNDQVFWGLEGPFPGGNKHTPPPVPFTPILIQPKTQAWVMINQMNVDNQAVWNRQLIYRDYNVTDPENGTAEYQIWTVMDSFNVMSIEKSPLPTRGGWYTVSNVGGFAFFTYILHSIMMFFLGFLFTNNSLFLNGESAAVSGGYQST